MKVCDLLILFVKLLPEMINLAKLIQKAIKKQTPPPEQRLSGVCLGRKPLQQI